MGRRKLWDNSSQHERLYAHPHLPGARAQAPPTSLQSEVTQQRIPVTQNKRKKQRLIRATGNDCIKNEQVLEEKYLYCLVLHLISETPKRDLGGFICISSGWKLEKLLLPGRPLISSWLDSSVGKLIFLQGYATLESHSESESKHLHCTSFHWFC